jgi:formate-dependent nitrite reductase membrane component NrfD/NAD-dependent dihydropyrimidine dehydrogenase PreA subunit
MRCNHCVDAPCVGICPTRALFIRSDGIVDFDTSRCIGCKSCMQACPYDALYIDPDEHTAQKCNYCVHRVEVGMEPACVVVCPEQAIVAGDLDDPMSRIAKMVATEQLHVRSPEQGTNPKLWYKGAEQVNLDPVMAGTRPGSMIWRDDPTPPSTWLTVDLTPGSNGGPPGPGRVAFDESAPRVVYTTDHPMPWGWRVSAYFLTKGIAAGLAVLAALVLLAGGSVSNAWARWGTPLASGVFLALTGVLLVWDLKRPDRFFYLLTKGNPRSWLVRGAWILSAYAAVLGLWLIAGVVGADAVVRTMTWIGAPLGLATAGYTAFLFGQAEARDLWQSPMLVWHMAAGAVAVGGGFGLLASLVFDVPALATTVALWAMVGGAATLGLMAWAELSSRHPTRNIEQALHHMTRGAFSRQWWLGGQALGVAVPILCGIGALSGSPDWVGAIGAVAVAAGIYFADDAFVKAGQSVPLS